jgi:hypothetical protein
MPKTPVDAPSAVAMHEVSAPTNGVALPHGPAVAGHSNLTGDPVARSRKQLQHYLSDAVQPDPPVSQKAGENVYPGNPGTNSNTQGQGEALYQEHGFLWNTLLTISSKWWDDQPWSRAVSPLVAHYEQRIRAQPASALAVAAACGAAIVVLRPWRLLVAASALSAALSKSTVIGQVANQLLAHRPFIKQPVRPGHFPVSPDGPGNTNEVRR